LTDNRYRGWVCRQTSDPFIRKFWAEEYESYDPRFQREAIAPIQNKLGQFLLNPVIRNILGQVRTKIGVRFMMDTRRLFIANLSKGKLGSEKANLLGCLLTTQFQLAAMSRANQMESERRDFFLFVDEFHNFATDSFAAILAEARKYRLCLTLSHQYIDQLPLPIRQAVFGNVGTLMSFGIGYADAEAMRSEFADAYVASQFVDLGKFEMFVRLFQDGAVHEPFRARALPPIENHLGRPAKLIGRSREKYATSRATVEAKLNRWIAR
ncbi:MAG TPA: type IV secretory system conjugative DNA transfer family protein, partial [Chthoniobacterales bacterium]